MTARMEEQSPLGPTALALVGSNTVTASYGGEADLGTSSGPTTLRVVATPIEKRRRLRHALLTLATRVTGGTLKWSGA
jgi:hypothetical protein